MSQIYDDRIPLYAISGLSPLNPRQDMDSDIAMLAATIRARGLLHPILIRPAPIEPQDLGDADGLVITADAWTRHEVLAGGRRWRALVSILTPETEIAVKIFDGTDAEAREAALAEATTQKPLHPVEEYEAFAALEAAGFTIPDIARDFALGERQVRQRLALGSLIPRVRALWREGTIDRDTAIAFTHGGPDAQEAALEAELAKPESVRWIGYHIKKALRHEAVEAREPLAKFLLGGHPGRLALYQQEGGRIEESLFAEETTLLDRSIANRVTDRLLLEEAQCVAEAEGWGAAMLYDQTVEDPLDIDGDYLAGEEERRDRIAAERRETSDPARIAELDAEEQTIDTRALLRAISKDQRATLGIACNLDHDGRIEIIRAIPLASDEEKDAQPDRQEANDDERETRAPATERREPSARGTKNDEPPAIPPPRIGKEAAAILDDAATLALSDAVSRNLGLALIFAVAALGCSYGRAGVRLDWDGRATAETKSQILADIEHEGFEKALLVCLDAPLSDLSRAFAELVGASIDTRGVDAKTTAILLAVASRLSDVTGDLANRIDYRGYFEASPRDVAIEAVRALAGDAVANDSGKLKKPDLVLRAERMARDRRWLPDIFTAATQADAPPPAKDERSTAQAMAEAIDADEAAHSAEALSGPAPERPETHRDAVAQFIDARCNRFLGAGLVKSARLYQAFVAFAESKHWPPVSHVDFGTAIAALGIEKKRNSAGFHYLDLALCESETSEAAE